MAKRKRAGRPVTEPGRARLPEDVIRNRNMDSGPRRGARKREPAPRVKVKPDRKVDILEVERRIIRAMKTLRSLPDRERRFHTVGSAWPPYAQEAMDAYASVEAIAPRFNPSPFDVSDFLTALSWARHLPKKDWDILWWRSFELSFGVIAEYIGRSDETARRRYRDIMVDVWCSANALA